jgi:hypothetical protein
MKLQNSQPNQTTADRLARGLWHVSRQLVGCDNFLYGFKGARLRLPPAPGHRPRQDRELKTRNAEDREREIRRAGDHQDQDLSGEWTGGLSAPGASAKPCPLGREP